MNFMSAQVLFLIGGAAAVLVGLALLAYVVRDARRLRRAERRVVVAATRWYTNSVAAPSTVAGAMTFGNPVYQRQLELAVRAYLDWRQSPARRTEPIRRAQPVRVRTHRGGGGGHR